MSYNLSLDNKLKNLIGESLNSFTDDKFSDQISKIKQLKFKEEYQGRIIDCMVGEVDDNYIETPETDEAIVKLEYSREGVVKVPSIKGKTIIVDSEGNETDTPGEGCRLVSVGEEEDNKLIFTTKSKNLFDKNKFNPTIIDGKEMYSYKILNDYIPEGLKEGTRYTVSFRYKNPNNCSWANIVLVYSNVQWQTTVNCIYEANEGDIVKVTTVDGRWLSKIYFNTQNSKELYIYDIMIEENSNVTEYTDYNFNKVEILLNEPLRSLPNGVCDEIIGNQLIRRIGVRKKIPIVDISKVDTVKIM